MAKIQVWELSRDGRRHTLTARDAGLSRRLEWRIDDELVAEKKTSDEKVRLTHGRHASTSGSRSSAAASGPRCTPSTTA